MIMLTPIVHEIYRRMEPIAPDPFLSGLPIVITRPYPRYRRPIAVIAARPGGSQAPR